MIPNKIEVMRKSYSPRVIELLKRVGTFLGSASINVDEVQSWQYTVNTTFATSEAERRQITWELAEAGWGCIFKYSSTNDELLVIYLRLS